METLLIMLPGYVFLQLFKTQNQKKKITDKLQGEFLDLRTLDGWQFVLQASALSIVFLGIPAFTFKLIGAFCLWRGYDVASWRAAAHEVFGDRYAITYLFGMFFALSPLWSRRVSRSIERLSRKFMAKPPVTPYEKILVNLLYESEDAEVFLKLKSKTYIIGVLGSVAPFLKDDQISIFPIYTGRRRILSNSEAAKVNLISGNLIATGEMKPVDTQTEYLVIDVEYPFNQELFEREQCTQFFIKMSEVEYISAFHQDIHDKFIREGKTVAIV